MKGAPTIGKAKALKEKRELAAELGELIHVNSVNAPASIGLRLPSRLSDSVTSMLFESNDMGRKYTNKHLPRLTEDDVVEFEAARGVSGSRSSRSKAKKRVEESNEEESDESGLGKVSRLFILCPICGALARSILKILEMS